MEILLIEKTNNLCVWIPIGCGRIPLLRPSEWRPCIECMYHSVKPTFVNSVGPIARNADRFLVKGKHSQHMYQIVWAFHLNAPQTYSCAARFCELGLFTHFSKYVWRYSVVAVVKGFKDGIEKYFAAKWRKSGQWGNAKVVPVQDSGHYWNKIPSEIHENKGFVWNQWNRQCISEPSSAGKLKER